jgi:acetyl esterase/lipase
MKRIVIVLILVLSLNGCTRIKIIGANFPALFAQQVANFDVAYGEKPHQKLDVYYPKNGKSDNPVIVYFYGGRWQFGSKGDYRFAADAFTERGYVVVIPDYVKYPEGKYPEFIQDGAEAIKWADKNIHQYKGDARHLYVVGHSAGGYIGAMLTANKKYGVSNKIDAFAGLAGAYHFTATELFQKEFAPIFDNPANLEDISVNKYVRKNQAPMLLLWGEDDKTVFKDHLDSLAGTIKKRGGKVQVKTYTAIDHVGIVATLSQIRRERAPVVDDVDKFFRSVR